MSGFLTASCMAYRQQAKQKNAINSLIGNGAAVRRYKSRVRSRLSRSCTSRSATENHHQEPRQQCQSTNKPNAVKIRPHTFWMEKMIRRRIPMNTQQSPNTTALPSPIYWRTRSVSPEVPRKTMTAILATIKAIISMKRGYHV